LGVKVTKNGSSGTLVINDRILRPLHFAYNYLKWPKN